MKADTTFNFPFWLTIIIESVTNSVNYKKRFCKSFTVSSFHRILTSVCHGPIPRGMIYIISLEVIMWSSHVSPTHSVVRFGKVLCYPQLNGILAFYSQDGLAAFPWLPSYFLLAITGPLPQSFVTTIQANVGNHVACVRQGTALATWAPTALHGL